MVRRMTPSMPLGRALQDGKQKEEGQSGRVEIVFNMEEFGIQIEEDR